MWAIGLLLECCYGIVFTLVFAESLLLFLCAAQRLQRLDPVPDAQARVRHLYPPLRDADGTLREVSQSSRPRRPRGWVRSVMAAAVDDVIVIMTLFVIASPGGHKSLIVS